MRHLIIFAILLSAFSVHAKLRCEDLFPSERPKYSLPGDHETMLLIGEEKDRLIPRNESFNLLVWNVYKARGKGFWNDLRKLQYDAHITLLQETLFNPAQCALLKGVYNTEWVNAISFWSEADTATGVSSGSRYFASEIGFIRSPDREPVIRTPKMAAYTKYPIADSDKDLVVVNLHGINVTPDHYLKNQLEAIETRIVNHQGPLVVAGDFNTRNSGRILILRKFADRLGLEILKMENDNRKSWLDHILARGLKVKQAKILKDIKSSDHPALWAELQVE